MISKLNGAVSKSIYVIAGELGGYEAVNRLIYGNR
jgi:hypothetical protein